MALAGARSAYEISVEVGGMPVALRTDDPAFVSMIKARYEGFVSAAENPEYRFDIDLFPPDQAADDTEDVSVSRGPNGWCIRRGDFRAEWDPVAKTGDHPAVLQSVFDRFSAVHRAHACAGGKGWVFVACRERGAEWAGVFVFGRVRGREDDDFAAGA